MAVTAVREWQVACPTHAPSGPRRPRHAARSSPAESRRRQGGRPPRPRSGPAVLRPPPPRSGGGVALHHLGDDVRGRRVPGGGGRTDREELVITNPIVRVIREVPF